MLIYALSIIRRWLLIISLAIAPCAYSQSPLAALASPKSGKALHESSSDREHHNHDFITLKPGDEITIFSHSGAASVRRFWVTIAPRQDPDILGQVILRMYWDDDVNPSVDCPIGAFFGVGFGEQRDYISLPLNETSGGYNCYWPMPFHKSARWTLTNRSSKVLTKFYYNIDYTAFDSIPAETRQFHAYYHRENPTALDKNYAILDVAGVGHYVGTAMFMSGQSSAFLEGNEMVYIDGSSTPTIEGTGTEDYFSSGWYFDRGTYSAPYHGVVIKEQNPTRISAYRWHIEDPIPFDKSIRFTIEHGAGNSATADYSSVAFFYLAGPAPALPSFSIEPVALTPKPATTPPQTAKPSAARPVVVGTGGYRSNYGLLSSGSVVQDKNFYALTLFEKIPDVRAELAADQSLHGLLSAKTTVATQGTFQTAVGAINFSDQEIESARSELVTRLPRSPALQALVTEHLRPSGRYIQSTDKTDADLLGEAWVEAAHGINRVIRQFANGKADTGIDAPSYDANTLGYQKMVLAAIQASSGNAKTNKDALFFEPSLAFALRLLEINRRDEPARHEPLASGENRLATVAASPVDWSKYKYAALLVHGIGLDDPGLAISDGSRENCAAAAKLYHDGLAPLIIVSGGYVHPKQTIFCEAIEMKKELMLVHGIPESAILVEPQARHTTTNVRNGVRLLLALGAPLDKPSLSVAQKEHVDYIASEKFRNYCLEHYGVRCGLRTSDTTAEFLPSVECMQIGEDPLDP